MFYNYIAIEGTLGAGKTTLASRIANDFNGKLVLEEFEADKNPFLPKFYKEPDKYSFQVEMTFLALRYQQLKDKGFFNNFFVKLSGDKQLQHDIENGKSDEEIHASWQGDLNVFKAIRAKYLMY